MTRLGRLAPPIASAQYYISEHIFRYPPAGKDSKPISERKEGYVPGRRAECDITTKRL